MACSFECIKHYIEDFYLSWRNVSAGKGVETMTVVLLICAVPPTGAPFVTISADSRASGEGGIVLQDDAKKIFEAGSAYMSTSGSADDEYREDLARILGEQPLGTIEEKMNALRVMLGEDKRDYNLQMNVGLVQFDGSGNPQMGLIGVNPEGQDALLGPYTYNKSNTVVEHVYFGAKRTPEVDKLREELKGRLTAEKINKASVENAAKWFIRKVAKIYPETVNSVVQTKTMRFK